MYVNEYEFKVMMLHNDDTVTKKSESKNKFKKFVDGFLLNFHLPMYVIFCEMRKLKLN